MKNQYGKEMDIASLKSRYATNILVRTLFDHLCATMNDAVRTLSVDDLQDDLTSAGNPITHETARRMLRTLEGTNIGQFKTGRRGYRTRFEFFTPPKTLAEIVTSGADSTACSDSAEAQQARSPSSMITHKLWLRPDLEVVVPLPADLNDRDVARLTDFIKTLPFSGPSLRLAA